MMSGEDDGSRPLTLYILVTSNASCWVKLGSMDGSARARRVFPLPGGPFINTLWPPAAPTSSARLACSWPRISARSTPPERPGPSPFPDTESPSWPGWPAETGAIISSPRKCAATSARLFTGKTPTPSTSAASLASDEGTKTVVKPSSLPTTTMGRIPLVCRRLPSRDSSPRNMADSGTVGIWPELRRMAVAMGKS